MTSRAMAFLRRIPRLSWEGEEPAASSDRSPFDAPAVGISVAVSGKPHISPGHRYRCGQPPEAVARHHPG